METAVIISVSEMTKEKWVNLQANGYRLWNIDRDLENAIIAWHYWKGQQEVKILNF